MKRLRMWLWWLWNGRDRLDMAWLRIEGLERQSAKIAAALLAQQSENKRLAAQSAEDVRVWDDLNRQMEDLRNIVVHTAREASEGQRVLKTARNWREVKVLMGDE